MVGLQSELLSKLRAVNKGGNSWNSFPLNDTLNGYMLTPRGHGGKDIVTAYKMFSTYNTLCFLILSTPSPINRQKNMNLFF